MRKVVKWVALLLIVAVVLAGLGGGVFVWVLKNKWRHAAGGLIVQTDDWLQHRLLTPAVLRNMPTPGLIGQPIHTYYCEGDEIEINHLHFQTTLARDEVLQELEPFIRGHGFEKTGPNYTQGRDQLNIAYQKQSGESWVKLFMTRR